MLIGEERCDIRSAVENVSNIKNMLHRFLEDLLIYKTNFFSPSSYMRSDKKGIGTGAIKKKNYKTYGFNTSSPLK